MNHSSLKDNRLFRLAYRRGARKSSRTVTVYALRDRAAGELRKKHPMKLTVNRVGISASKKVGGAVQRNRAKRVIREALRQIDHSAGLKKGYLIVVVPKPECTVCKMQDVKSDLMRCLEAVNLTAGTRKSPEPERNMPVGIPEPDAVPSRSRSAETDPAPGEEAPA